MAAWLRDRILSSADMLQYGDAWFGDQVRTEERRHPDPANVLGVMPDGTLVVRDDGQGPVTGRIQNLPRELADTIRAMFAPPIGG